MNFGNSGVFGGQRRSGDLESQLKKDGGFVKPSSTRVLLTVHAGISGECWLKVVHSLFKILALPVELAKVIKHESYRYAVRPIQ
jgi:hypothetical protein